MIKIKKQPIIKTKRLTLRPFLIEDGDQVQRLAGSKDIAYTTQYIPHPYPDGYAQAWIATLEPNFEQHLQAIWAIVLSESNTLIGSIGLDFFHDHNNASMGYWVGKEYWNNNYATEAAKGVIAFGFKVLELHRIQAKHLVRNPSSGRVLTKAGMQYEGTERESTLLRGDFETLSNYAILRKDYMQACALNS